MNKQKKDSSLPSAATKTYGVAQMEADTMGCAWAIVQTSPGPVRETSETRDAGRWGTEVAAERALQLWLRRADRHAVRAALEDRAAVEHDAANEDLSDSK